MPNEPLGNFFTIAIVAPYAIPLIGFLVIPYLTHSYASLRERQSRLHSIINELQNTFDEINQIFFESVLANKTTPEEQIADAVREQQIIIHLEKINVICKRASKFLKNVKPTFHQKEASIIRRIATNDQRRKSEFLTESSRQISASQNDIIEALSEAHVISFFNIFK
ncbi:hypothetical protein [Marinomonas sp. ef1]|uniref:hypothetical protein n=1 Tax=Marinomonas sp. ef1 TaxID=2005043 RepID=UPI000C28987D|nr:hypothetical protein [Marinomonas sp. ef1]